MQEEGKAQQEPYPIEPVTKIAMALTPQQTLHLAHLNISIWNYLNFNFY